MTSKLTLSHLESLLLRACDDLRGSMDASEYNFQKEKELDALVKGLKIGREILAQAAMAPFHGGEEVPGPALQGDDALRDFVRSHVETVYHTAGSCRMGVDDLAVVDPELRVHGVDRLRVVDSSVMPTITGSNIHAPTVMIAERAAGLVGAAGGAASAGGIHPEEPPDVVVLSS